MKMRAVAPMRVAKIGYIIMSAVFCVVGILFITCPKFSALIMGKTLGIAMMVFGCIKLVGYFSKDLFRLAFQYDLGFGILLCILGLFVTLKTENILNFICIAIGIAILTDALFKVQIAIDSKQFGINAWWVIMSLAIVTVVVGLILVLAPFESVKFLTVLLGIALLAEGILNLCVTLSTVKIIKNQHPDIVIEDDTNQ